MNFKLVNHASLLIEAGHAKILTDPWPSGKIFDSGWSLIEESSLPEEHEYDYVWISHEHPDHFTPWVFGLKRIKSNKKILLQKRDDDHKLKNFFLAKGHNVIEITNTGVEVEGVILKGGTNKSFDSWLSVTYHGKTILNLNKIIFSIIFSFFYLKKTKPEIVFGMGGYSSFPVCVASYLLKIPIIVYENNLVLGRANRALLPLVRKILVSTKNTYGIKKKYEDKIFVSGHLLRKEIFELEKDRDKKNNEELSVLIIGGSQSAKVFGEKIPEIIVQCYKKNIKLKIYQQCLEKQMKEIEKIMI